MKAKAGEGQKGPGSLECPDPRRHLCLLAQGPVCSALKTCSRSSNTGKKGSVCGFGNPGTPAASKIETLPLQGINVLKRELDETQRNKPEEC